jgi:hypothetical protein
MTPVQLLNLALLKIGVSKSVTTISDATREAYTGGLVFDHILRATLRQFPWPFATKYLALTLTQGPASSTATVQTWTSGQIYAVGDVVTSSGTTYYCILAHSVDHAPPNLTYWSTTATTQANGDWTYAYRWPSDCLFARRFLPSGTTASLARAYNENPPPYRVGRDANGLLLYAKEDLAVLEYTVIDCDHLWADDLFIDAFTWRLAAYLAPSLAKDEKLTQSCAVMYRAAGELAATVATREHQPEKNGEAEWINTR